MRPHQCKSLAKKRTRDISHIYGKAIDFEEKYTTIEVDDSGDAYVRAIYAFAVLMAIVSWPNTRDVAILLNALRRKLVLPDHTYAE
jgi:hypothetical protein